MSKKSNPALIGGFVLGAGVLIIAGLLIFGGGRFFEDTETHVLYFDGSVKGLSEGAPVMFRGVRIGSVKEIGVLCDARDLSFNIRVVVETFRGRIKAIGGGEVAAEAERIHHSGDIVGMLIEEGLRGQLQLQSLVTGKLYVEFDMHPDTPVEYSQIQDEYKEIPTIVSSMEEFTRTFENLPLQEIVTNLTSTLKGVDRLVNSPEMKASLQNLEKALAQIGAMAENVDNRIGTVTQSFNSTSTKAQETLDKAEELLVSLKDATAEGSDLRYELLHAIQEVSDAARSIRLLSQTLETRPESLLRGKAQGGGAQ